MISLMDEDLIALRDVPGVFPPRGGKRLHVSTPYRWMSMGLETMKVGGTLFTSREALQRFAERCSGGTKTPETTTRTATARRSAIDRAERDLDRAGV